MDNKRNILLFSLLALSSLGFRMPGLLESIWYDEAYRTGILLNAKLLNRILFHDIHNFLYNGFMYLWIQVFGDSELSIRTPSLLLGFGSIAVFSLWTHRRLGGATAACVLVFLLFSPFHIWYSTEAKNNMMVMFFAATIFVSYANLIEKREWKWVAWAAVTGSLGVFTDFLLLLTLLGIIIMSLLEVKIHPGEGVAKKLITALGLTACLILPLILFKAYHQDEMLRGYLKTFDLEELFLLLCNFLPTGNAIFPIRPYRGLKSVTSVWQLAFLSVTSLGVIAALFKGLYEFRHSRHGIAVITCFVVPIALMFCLSWYVSFRFGGKNHVFLERALGSVIFYLYSLVLIHGAMKFRNRALRHGLLAFLLVANLIGSVFMLTVNRDQWTVYKPNPDWRSLSRDLDGALGDAMVFTSCDSLALQYYLKDLGDRAVFFNPPVKDGVMHLGPYIQEAFLKRGIRNPSFFYIVVNQYWGSKKLAAVNREVISKLYGQVEEKRYFGLAVYKYRFKHL